MNRNEACIFNIQKFSLNDGPGIRTTVFFKGCPLHCLWCSNPESQYPRQELSWDEDKCIHCLACVSECPNGGITAEDHPVQGRYPIYHKDKCQLCLGCAEICPSGALLLQGIIHTQKSVFTELLQDKDFYEESGGGVTFSGGEVLMQAEFSILLAHHLHEEGIHISAETTGFAPPEVFVRFMAEIDLFLFDIKHYDREQHYATTGVYPDLIWQNLTMALAANKKVFVRIPVVPDINNSLGDALGFAAKLKELGIQRVQLLPFHQFGQKKYAMLNKAYEFTHTKQLYEEDLTDYCAIFIKQGIDAFF